MNNQKMIFDSTPYVQVPHSRKMALKCFVCGRTVIMTAKLCDGRSCPHCGGAIMPIGYVAPLRSPTCTVGVDMATGESFTLMYRAPDAAGDTLGGEREGLPNA